MTADNGWRYEQANWIWRSTTRSAAKAMDGFDSRHQEHTDSGRQIWQARYTGGIPPLKLAEACFGAVFTRRKKTCIPLSHCTFRCPAACSLFSQAQRIDPRKQTMPQDRNSEAEIRFLQASSRVDMSKLYCEFIVLFKQ